MNRIRNFYYRWSNKELEALQSFSFLDDISISNPDEGDEISDKFSSECLLSMDFEKEQVDNDNVADEQKQVIPEDSEID